MSRSLSRMARQYAALVGLGGMLAACGGAPRTAVSAPPAPIPADVDVADSLPNAPDVYRSAGLIVPDSGGMPFVGTVRYLASRSTDSTLVLVAISLANRALTFTPLGAYRRASYGVTIDLGEPSRAVIHLESLDTVEVASFREATRAEESIIYRRYVRVQPGAYQLTLSVRDAGGTRQASQRVAITVPRLAAGTVSSPIPVYRGTPRSSPDSLPQLIPNIRSVAVFGRDSTMPIYLEGYGMAPTARLVISVANPDMATLWSDTLGLPQRGELRDAILDLPVTALGVGRATVRASLVGSADTVQTPVFVTFGERWTIGSFDEMLSLLRYFASEARLQALRDAPTSERAALWTSFLRETDPNPRTPQHEALEGYFDRLGRANDTFRERDRPGWLTDRGRVLATLGEPDQVLQDAFAGGPPSNRSSAQTWLYSRYRLRLVFTNQAGPGRWRLDPQSETAFESVAQQVRAR
jgi:GWxTD domain-containing protein